MRERRRLDRALSGLFATEVIAPGLICVTSSSGREYYVDLLGGACECEDFANRGEPCKHYFRAVFEYGLRGLALVTLPRRDRPSETAPGNDRPRNRSPARPARGEPPAGRRKTFADLR